MSSSGGDLNNSIGIEGGSDSTIIGNTGDRLKVDAEISNVTPIPVEIQSDLTAASGSTEHVGGSATLSAVAYPSVAGAKITGALFHNRATAARSLLVSFDGGTSFITIDSQDSFVWSPKNITQIYVKGSSSLGTAWEGIINYE